MLDILADIEDFHMNYTLLEDIESFSTVNEDNQATGLLSSLQDNTYDIVLNGMVLIDSRARAFNYLYGHTAFYDDVRVFVPVAPFIQKWKKVVLEFESTVWLMTGMRIVVRGEALQQSRSQPARMLVRVMPVPLDLATPYWVVHTDYDSYSVVWSCNDYDYFHTENAWILTRQREPSLDTLQKAYTIVDENNMSRAYFAKTDHTNCTEIEPEKMLEIV
ncbi:hypothetical protein JYU34_003608 [Plutella xylostella]|uniref:Lipocalin/cytosolic fatty-acid binding domain-containing protein n=1 Tax=Plutella xylostella TaxID=51655 RepID=A0ABQ7R0H2_PLUXY|nr:hypothetical protein JYU34_003608 [Plutella xylostella]